jgi:hypothetical protein
MLTPARQAAPLGGYRLPDVKIARTKVQTIMHTTPKTAKAYALVSMPATQHASKIANTQTAVLADAARKIAPNLKAGMRILRGLAETLSLRTDRTASRVKRTAAIQTSPQQ